jgi:hypothetical protein
MGRLICVKSRVVGHAGVKGTSTSIMRMFVTLAKHNVLRSFSFSFLILLILPHDKIAHHLQKHLSACPKTEIICPI